MKTILKAVRCPDFDMVGDKHYGDRPYGVVLDVYDTDDNFIENGTDWTYFANETEAEDYCRVFNGMNGDTIDGMEDLLNELYLLREIELLGKLTKEQLKRYLEIVETCQKNNTYIPFGIEL